jgi:hypothetical protein
VRERRRVRWIGTSLLLLSTSGALAQHADGPAEQDGQVTLHGDPVFELRVGSGQTSTAERARLASAALGQAAKDASAEAVRVEWKNGVAVVYAGRLPIVQLTVDDARLAGDASLEVHANLTAERVRRAVALEQTRSALAGTLFAISLAVFLALLTVYAVRKSKQWAAVTDRWLAEHADRVPTIHIRSLELATAASVRTSARLLVAAADWMLRLGLPYAWLVVTAGQRN